MPLACHHCGTSSTTLYPAGAAYLCTWCTWAVECRRCHCSGPTGGRVAYMWTVDRQQSGGWLCNACFLDIEDARLLNRTVVDVWPFVQTQNRPIVNDLAAEFGRIDTLRRQWSAAGITFNDEGEPSASADRAKWRRLVR